MHGMQLAEIASCCAPTTAARLPLALPPWSL